MTIDEIKELIQVVHDTGIAELEVQRGDNRVKITRSKSAAQEVVMPTMVSVPVATASVAAQMQPLTVGPNTATPSQALPPAPEPSARAHSEPEAMTEENGYVSVKSPIVGTYYDSPAPGSPPFVKIGDRVEPKQVLCIIESMKLMNEIEAELAGTLVAKLVENGRPVEYGESLFTIRPLTAA